MSKFPCPGCTKPTFGTKAFTASCAGCAAKAAGHVERRSKARGRDEIATTKRFGPPTKDFTVKRPR